MDIVKVINSYIGDVRSNLGEAVEDVLLDLEIEFNLGKDSIFDNLKKTQSNPLRFSAGFFELNDRRIKSVFQESIRLTERRYDDLVGTLTKARINLVTLRIDANVGYALIRLEREYRSGPWEISFVIVKQVKAATTNPYLKNKGRKFEIYVPGWHALSGFATYDESAYDYVAIEYLYRGCVTPEDFIYRSIVLADQTRGNRAYKGWVIFRKAAESMRIVPSKTKPNLYTYSFKDGFGNSKILQVEFR